MSAFECTNPVLRPGGVQLFPQLHEFTIVEVGIADGAKVGEFHAELRGLADGKAGRVCDHTRDAAVAGQRNGRGQARPSRHPGQVTPLFLDRKPVLRVMPHCICGGDGIRHRAIARVVRGHHDVPEFLRCRPDRFNGNFTPGARIKRIENRPLSRGRKSGWQVERITLFTVSPAHNFGDYFAGRK